VRVQALSTWRKIMSKVIHGKQFADAILASGFVGVDDRVTRIVIDAPVGDIVKVYVERIGDERLLNVVPGLAGAEIKYVTAE
jgi:hypothetical protein